MEFPRADLTLKTVPVSRVHPAAALGNFGDNDGILAVGFFRSQAGSL